MGTGSRLCGLAQAQLKSAGGGKEMTRRSRFSRAQFIVLFTLALPVLVGAVGLGADFAILYLNWANLQKAADSAALAGAEYLIANPQPPAPPPTAASCPTYSVGDTTNDPMSVSCTYSVINGAKRAEWSANVGTLPSGAPTLQVVLNRPDISTYFLRLVGVSSLAAKAQATAAVESADCTKAFPVALQCNDSPCDMSGLDPNQTGGVQFNFKFVGGLAPGNWDWANVGQGTGAQQLGNAIRQGSNTQYCIGQNVSTSPGHKQSSGVVNNGLQDLLKTCAAYSNPGIDNPCGANGVNAIGPDTGQVPPGDPCLVTVPTVNYQGCTGNCTMPITNFVSIYIEQTSTAANIDGCFVKTLDLQASGGGSFSNLGTLAPPKLID
jgi:Flp pilus assembly protein TadG